jgi:transposase-like zinc ribbon protein
MQADFFSIQSFPNTLEEFKKLFRDEEVCLRFLFSKRWPNGFECPYCSWVNKELQPTKTMTCGHCGHPTSITTNTIMHGTKKPLSQWLICIWWLTSTSGGNSAKDLQRLLKLSSYQTAWTWLQKLRMAMSIADNKQCRDTVEFSSDTISLGGDSQTNPLILSAAEIILPAGITGRIKMASTSSLSNETINDFLNHQVSSGSSLIVPDKNTLGLINKKNFITVTDPAIYRTRQIIKSFEIWINKIHRGGVAAKHLQLYLDEFCFRRNSEMLPDRKAIFDLLLSGVISKKSLSYKGIISQSTKE